MWRALNLSLLLLFPLAWVAPLLHAEMAVPVGAASIRLPFFGTQDISVLSGVAALWDPAPVLALLVALFAILAPLGKIIAAEISHHARGPAWLPTATRVLARLAMADIFLIALYIVAAKGMTLTDLRPGWGLYLFTFCVLAGLAITIAKER